MTHGWSHSHKVPRFQALHRQSWHLRPQARLPLNTLGSVGKERTNGHPAPLPSLEHGCSVTLPNPSVECFLISCFIQNPPQPVGARRHSPEPPMLISHHLPGVGGRLPVWSARTTEGLDVGCNCPYSDATDYLPRQLHFCATVQGTWHPYFWAFPEILQQTALPGCPLCRHQDFSPETNSPVIALPYFLGQNCVDMSTPSLGEGAK